MATYTGRKKIGSLDGLKELRDEMLSRQALNAATPAQVDIAMRVSLESESIANDLGRKLDRFPVDVRKLIVHSVIRRLKADGTITV